jgi:predicted RNase H-like HicB family nuclease
MLPGFIDPRIKNVFASREVVRQPPATHRYCFARYNLNKKQETCDMTRTFTALIHKEDDWYVADCPEVGTVSQGKTVEEAVANLKEATELYLEEFPLPETNHPLLTTFEVATYA